jgi:hypothetical protein
MPVVSVMDVDGDDTTAGTVMETPKERGTSSTPDDDREDWRAAPSSPSSEADSAGHTPFASPTSDSGYPRTPGLKEALKRVHVEVLSSGSPLMGKKRKKFLEKIAHRDARRRQTAAAQEELPASVREVMQDIFGDSAGSSLPQTPWAEPGNHHSGYFNVNEDDVDLELTMSSTSENNDAGYSGFPDQFSCKRWRPKHTCVCLSGRLRRQTYTCVCVCVC